MKEIPIEGKAAVQKEKEINLKALYVVLRKRFWMILLITIVFTVVGGMYNSRPETPVYTASSRMIIAASQDMMSTVRALFREPIVLEKVIEELDLDQSVGGLRSQIRVANVDASLITVVSVVDSNPERAADIANESFNIYKQVAAETLNITSIRLLSEAIPNPNPINEKTNTLVYVAFLMGLFIGVALTFLLDSLDDSIRSEREIEQMLGLTVLGHVSVMKKKDLAKHSKKQKSVMVRGEVIGS